LLSTILTKINGLHLWLRIYGNNNKMTHRPQALIDSCYRFLHSCC